MSEASAACRPLLCESEDWAALAGKVANRLHKDIQPHTVLAAARAPGMLVQALRGLGIEAYGLDTSQPACPRGVPAAQPYVSYGSLAAALPRSYDLILCIDGVEHLPGREAETAIGNVCAATDDIIFATSPAVLGGAAQANAPTAGYWAEGFARHGFYRDQDYDPAWGAAWTARFRRSEVPAWQVIGSYERRLWLLEQDAAGQRQMLLEQERELAAQEAAVASLSEAVAERERLLGEVRAAQARELQRLLESRQWAVQELAAQLAERERRIGVLSDRIRYMTDRQATLEATPGWRVLRTMQTLRGRLAPPGSARDRSIDRLMAQRRARQFRKQQAVLRQGEPAGCRQEAIQVEPVPAPLPVLPHECSIDIIICVHNALADTQRCLASVLERTAPPRNLILVDDGSDGETCAYLAAFAAVHGAMLLRNEEAQGYTRAANRGLRASTADFSLLLNSDTVVTPGWLDRLVACATSDPKIGIAGPLSNTASWQSIPEYAAAGDWAENPLPPGVNIDEMARLVAENSARLYPAMPFLNGFCLLLRRQMLGEVGYFDEEAFGAGYGEENDYALRARQAGWRLTLADDAYVYHAQSRSYSSERRKQLSDRAGAILAQKYDPGLIDRSVLYCRQDRVLEGIRARSRAMLERSEWVKRGRARFAGRKVLFVLPVIHPGGGANVVLLEGMAMHRMGVEVELFNLRNYKHHFEQAYPCAELPVRYGEQSDLAELGAGYDAVVATFHPSVSWLEAIPRRDGLPVRGYYVQDFEPYFYPPDTPAYRSALASYALFPDLVRFTKTEWTRRELLKQTGMPSWVTGPSVNIDLFRPRPRAGPPWPERPLRIGAMIRPSSINRAPRLTMEVLGQAARQYGASIEIMLFGVAPEAADFVELPRDFDYRIGGILSPEQTANYLNQVDTFVDFSAYQAMGLTALEAMCCGAAVILPARGGAGSFAVDQSNSLLIDTSSAQTCWQALQRLVEDGALREQLQANALRDACAYYPERPAYHVLDALFEPSGMGSV